MRQLEHREKTCAVVAVVLLSGTTHQTAAYPYSDALRNLLHEVVYQDSWQLQSLAPGQVVLARTLTLGTSSTWVAHEGTRREAHEAVRSRYHWNWQANRLPMAMAHHAPALTASAVAGWPLLQTA